jgi:hypothetical protein
MARHWVADLSTIFNSYTDSPHFIVHMFTVRIPIQAKEVASGQYRYIYYIHPKLGLVIAVFVLGREHGRFRGDVVAKAAA